MIVVVKHPGFAAEVQLLTEGDLLSQLQKLVGGYIQIAWRAPRYFGPDELVVYCNEEGLLHELPFNLPRPSDGHPVVGTIVAVKSDGAGEDFSMTMEDAERVQSHLTLYAESLARVERLPS